ncbi:AQG_2a_G0039270.mRNA.1.CDS.1 [Saccharomyces cerevisiae]|uniref:Rpn13p n=2 Tax=Saccharomyces cerevisiae TaxID=4932 RepID=C7GXM2_YEAS2|nr:Rpn13p [Saccharomyces cerevisiae YJM993]AJP40547.1 Rpn13p [Saccharomyces cerevisiae YJM1078]AJV46903.1 Rpn13p [Saccharomyces cerevisiae YJM1129]AJV47804.1 Rpn13p [Saccharomyces cerevisiae YJM1190]AJV49622.1 Rpn13p [Saccharomyces cerevisiae YJM1242]AJV50067.1 Rpn13p [Saccharomyces cerevisiae YJM1244]AJV50939.1 Rpn13p [Saccharomyces cerevisiae YJM1250]AJV51385.1 Rpn13p [Saccharomyces cerevisiae YJM1252]AJV54077.1 Rpn13p [Saccharomyces cerevisiae YJM1332]AJV54531.1 Rpn13p [Saccharomyces ce
MSMSSTVIKFRAGVCEYNEDSRLCTPIPVQGEIEIKPNEEEELGFWDFEWRPTEKPVGRELDPISLILIPGETMWVPIKSSKSGRIFALVFSSNERYFFWLQEKNSGNLSLNELSTKDKEIYNKMIGVLNNSSESDEEESNDEKQKAQDVDVSMQD